MELWKYLKIVQFKTFCISFTMWVKATFKQLNWTAQWMFSISVSQGSSICCACVRWLVTQSRMLHFTHSHIHFLYVEQQFYFNVLKSDPYQQFRIKWILFTFIYSFYGSIYTNIYRKKHEFAGIYSSFEKFYLINAIRVYMRIQNI